MYVPALPSLRHVRLSVRDALSEIIKATNILGLWWGWFEADPTFVKPILTFSTLSVLPSSGLNFKGSSPLPLLIRKQSVLYYNNWFRQCVAMDFRFTTVMLLVLYFPLDVSLLQINTAFWDMWVAHRCAESPACWFHLNLRHCLLKLTGVANPHSIPGNHNDFSFL